MLSNSQVDRIGDRLRRGDVDEEVLTKLTQYQSEFDIAYKHVERVLTKRLYLTITGRPAKSTLSVAEKLRRIKSRLSQMQDMSGCRAIVHNLTEQNEAVRRAGEWFSSLEVDDKREVPTHGYRAVHLLITHEGKCVEVQIRTRIQHFWATVSEKLSDTYGQEIKYGQGNKEVLSLLDRLSDNVRRFDMQVDRLHEAQGGLMRAKASRDVRRAKEISKRIGLQEESIRHVMYEARAILMKFDQMEKSDVLLD